jgi:hypothetical protein
MVLSKHHENKNIRGGGKSVDVVFIYLSRSRIDWGIKPALASGFLASPPKKTT